MCFLITGLISTITLLGQGECPPEIVKKQNELAKKKYMDKTKYEEIIGNSFVCELSTIPDATFGALCDRIDCNPNYEMEKNRSPNLSGYVMYAKNPTGETNVFCADLDRKTGLVTNSYRGKLKGFDWTQREYKGKQEVHLKNTDDAFMLYLKMATTAEDMEGMAYFIKKSAEAMPYGNIKFDISGADKLVEQMRKQIPIEDRIAGVVHNFSQKVKDVEEILKKNKDIDDGTQKKLESFLKIANLYKQESSNKSIEIQKEMEKKDEQCEKCREEQKKETERMEAVNSSMDKVLEELKKFS